LVLGDGFSGLGNLGFGESLDYAFDVVTQSAIDVAPPATAPEPGTAGLLMGAGVLCAIGSYRRKRREER